MLTRVPRILLVLDDNNMIEAAADRGKRPTTILGRRRPVVFSVVILLSVYTLLTGCYFAFTPTLLTTKYEAVSEGGGYGHFVPVGHGHIATTPEKEERMNQYETVENYWQRFERTPNHSFSVFSSTTSNELLVSRTATTNNGTTITTTTTGTTNSSTHWCIVDHQALLAIGFSTPKWFSHFPHACEILLPCWSWFRRHSASRCGLVLLDGLSWADSSWHDQLFQQHLGWQILRTLPTTSSSSKSRTTAAAVTTAMMMFTTTHHH